MINPGDKIICKGLNVTVKEVISQTNYGTDDNPDHYVEFNDINGHYHYWKQSVDGGMIIRPYHPEYIKSIEDGQFSVDIHMCKCGFYIGLDCTYLAQVGNVSVHCPSCNRLLFVEQYDD